MKDIYQGNPIPVQAKQIVEGLTPMIKADVVH